MPSPERIEKLHDQLVPLGDEPAVAAERGEIIEPPRRPETNLDDDLSALLDDAESDSERIGAQEGPGEGEAEGAGEDADTAALLADLDSVFDTDDEEVDDTDGAPEEEDPFAGL
ncbi:MAG: periplasmic-type flagellar collar protein FlcA, partial [Alkalispirochaeta sp.]